jgi:hypothetical protein
MNAVTIPLFRKMQKLGLAEPLAKQADACFYVSLILLCIPVATVIYQMFGIVLFQPDLSVARTKPRVLLSAEYRNLGCCDMYTNPHCEMTDKCYSLVCRDTPLVNPYRDGRRRSMGGYRVYDLTDYTPSTPHIVFVPNLISLEDGMAFIEHAKSKLKRSVTFTNVGEGEMQATSWRTSHDSGVDWNFPPLVRLHKKLSYLLHTPREHFEGAVILRYSGYAQKRGERYVPHNDWFDDVGLIKGEQRVKTLVVFLNHVPEGGETVFPRANVKVHSERGAGVLWQNMKPDQGNMLVGDDNALHGGCYPGVGMDKWILTIWIHDAAVKWKKDGDS